MEHGLIQLYCGDGKGKTTASVGAAIRAIGNNEQVLFIQFMKDGNSGEVPVLKGIPGIEYYCAEELPKGFYNRMNPDEQVIFKRKQMELFEKMLVLAKDISDQKGGVIILDEVIHAYNKGFLDKERFLVFLNKKPENLEVILTGRDPDEKIVDLADYFTDMNLKKHPFQNGVAARKGIEF